MNPINAFIPPLHKINCCGYLKGYIKICKQKNNIHSIYYKYIPKISDKLKKNNKLYNKRNLHTHKDVFKMDH